MPTGKKVPGKAIVKKPSEIYNSLRDNEWVLEQASLFDWEDTGNPVHVWRVIGNCLREKRSLPEWVQTYLLHCADRMEAPSALGRKDLRAALPGIFGFKGKKGGENLLNPDQDSSDRLSFLLNFSRSLEEGLSASKARSAAAAESFSPDRADSIKDQTLVKWLREELSLDELPKNQNEWRKVCRSYWKNLYDQLDALDRDLGA